MTHEQYKTIDHDPDMGLNNKNVCGKIITAHCIGYI